MQNYDVTIYVAGRVCSNITVRAENAEAAEDLASESVTLKATKSYDKKTETEEPTTRPIEEGSLPETTN